MVQLRHPGGTLGDMVISQPKGGLLRTPPAGSDSLLRSRSLLGSKGVTPTINNWRVIPWRS